MTVARCPARAAHSCACSTSGAGIDSGNHFSCAVPLQAEHPPAVIATVALQRRADGVVSSECCATGSQPRSRTRSWVGRRMAGLGAAGWLWCRPVSKWKGGASLAPCPAAAAPAGAVWIATGAGRTGNDAGRDPGLAGGEFPIRPGRVPAGPPVPGPVARRRRQLRANCSMVARIKP